MRLFFALMPDPDLEFNLHQIQSELKPGRGWHAVPPENLHLTLAFLGDTNTNALARLENVLDAIPLPWELPEVLGGYPSALPQDLPHALAWEWDHALLVQEIQANLGKALRAAGFELEKRKFRPHITLFRAARGSEFELQLDQIKGQVGGSFRSLALVKSRPSENGSIYSIITERLLTMDDEE